MLAKDCTVTLLLVVVTTTKKREQEIELAYCKAFPLLEIKYNPDIQIILTLLQWPLWNE